MDCCSLGISIVSVLKPPMSSVLNRKGLPPLLGISKRVGETVGSIMAIAFRPLISIIFAREDPDFLVGAYADIPEPCADGILAPSGDRTKRVSASPRRNTTTEDWRLGSNIPQLKAAKGRASVLHPRRASSTLAVISFSDWDMHN